jgi:hypothetical protein
MKKTRNSTNNKQFIINKTNIFSEDILTLFDYNVLLLLRSSNKQLLNLINGIITKRNKKLGIDDNSREFILKEDLPLYIIKYLYKKIKNYNKEFKFINKVICSNNITNFEWLQDNGCYFYYLTCIEAIKIGNIDTIKWLLNNNYLNFDDENNNIINPFNYITFSNNISLVEYLLLNDYKLNTNLFANAAKDGNLEILILLDNKNCPKNEQVFENAAINGNLDNMKWLQKNNYPWNKNTFANAALNGNLDNMKWLRKFGCPWNEKTFANAAKNGNLDNMIWLRKFGCPWNEKTFANAAKNGNLDNMIWLKQNGCKLNELTFANAALNGNLDNMKWLKEIGCKWNELTFANAAKNNSLDNMEWLIQNNCPWNDLTFDNIITNNDNINNIIKKLDWLKQKCFCFNNDNFANAVLHGELKIIEWFKKNKYINKTCNPNIFINAARNGNLTNMKWLYSNFKCKLNYKVFNEAVIHGDINIVIWLNEIGCDYGTITLNNAINNSNVEVINWLINNDCKIGNIEQSNYIFNKKNILIIIGKLGISLSKINPKYKDDYDLVNKFINYNPYNYKYISQRLKGDINIIKKTIELNINTMSLINNINIKKLDPNFIDTSIKFNNIIKYYNYDTIKYFLDNNPNCPMNDETFIVCLKTENSKIIELLIEKNCKINNDAFNEVLIKLDIKFINYLINKGFKFGKNIINYILSYNIYKSNMIELVKLLLNNGYTMNLETLKIAIKHDNNNIVKFLIDNNCPIPPNENIINYTLELNRLTTLSIIEVLIEKGFKFDNNSIKIAIRKYNITNIKFLINNKCLLDNDIIYYILNIKANDKYKIDIINLLIGIEYKIDNNICYNILNYSNLEVIKLIIDYKFSYDKNIINIIIKKNNLNIIKYLVNTNHEFGNSIINNAIENDNIELVNYLIDIKCQFNIDTMNYAIKKSNIQVINYLLDNKYNFSSNTINYAIETNNLAFINYLIDNNCKYINNNDNDIINNINKCNNISDYIKQKIIDFLINK